jgi:hypothetical protein
MVGLLLFDGILGRMLVAQAGMSLLPLFEGPRVSIIKQPAAAAWRSFATGRVLDSGHENRNWG